MEKVCRSCEYYRIRRRGKKGVQAGGMQGVLPALMRV